MRCWPYCRSLGQNQEQSQKYQLYYSLQPKSLRLGLNPLPNLPSLIERAKKKPLRTLIRTTNQLRKVMQILQQNLLRLARYRILFHLSLLLKALHFLTMQTLQLDISNSERFRKWFNRHISIVSIISIFCSFKTSYYLVYSLLFSLPRFQIEPL